MLPVPLTIPEPNNKLPPVILLVADINPPVKILPAVVLPVTLVLVPVITPPTTLAPVMVPVTETTDPK